MVLFHRGEDFYGLPVITASNGGLELDVLNTVGPRIIRLRSQLAGNENIFAEVPDLRIPTSNGSYQVMGGHRLQTAPETLPSTYVPDGKPVQIQQMADGLEVSSPIELETGLSRSITVHFTKDQEQITLRHCLKNHGQMQIQVSGWCLTMLPSGGRIIMPLRISSNSTTHLMPDRSLVFWPYSRVDAGDFSLTDKTATFMSCANHSPFKFGGLAGWLAYEFNNLVFVKTFTVYDDLPYPDRGCSAEVYANGDFVELESLSPLVQLEPGQSIEHIEDWFLMKLDNFSAFLIDH